MQIDFSILVVDDEEEMISCLTDLLTREGYQVDSAPNGKAALEKCRKKDYDLILSDIMMPEMDGIELLRKIEELMYECRMVMMTGYSSIEGAVESIKLGADDYITKPFSPSEIRKMVGRYYQNKQLMEENRVLKERLNQSGAPVIIGKSRSFQTAMKQVEAVADQSVHILITGESGTGKDLAAQSIHYQSRRKGHPFIAINCAAIPKDLLESELFGHEKGSFTGAYERKYGLFEVADKGTLFLDEIGDMDMGLQSKLLRAVESGAIRRIGGTKNITVDIRIVSSTNRNLEKRISEGRFRSDLFYRLCGFHIQMPPLRERKSDIPLLVGFLLAKRKQSESLLSESVMDALKRYTWPGNIRELENMIDRLLIVSRGREIGLHHLPVEFRESERPGDRDPGEYPMRPLKELEREHILAVLKVLNGEKAKAARVLGIGLKTLYRKLDMYTYTEDQ